MDLVNRDSTAGHRPESYAQFGEDLGILDFFGDHWRGYFVDVGGNDGIRDSNTALLEERGWQGVVIEANPELTETAKTRRACVVLNYAVTDRQDASSLVFYAVKGPALNLNGLSTTCPSDEFFAMAKGYGATITEILVPCKTLTAILDEAKCPAKIDVLSVDVEGAEVGVIESLDFVKYEPRLIICENNAREEHGALHRVLAGKGYVRVHRTGVNDWYVRPDNARKFIGKRVLLKCRFLRDRIRKRLGKLVSAWR